MDGFERELREQLTAREAPAGFAARVMARVERKKKPAWAPAWRWAAAMALVAAAAAGSVEHAREQRMEGERARAQVMLALRITGTTLRDVRERVARR